MENKLKVRAVTIQVWGWNGYLTHTASVDWLRFSGLKALLFEETVIQ